MPRRADSKPKPTEPKQKSSDSTGTTEQKSAPTPNTAILQAVSAGSIDHIKCPKLNEVDKLLDDNLLDIESGSKRKELQKKKDASDSNTADLSTNAKTSESIKPVKKGADSDQQKQSSSSSDKSAKQGEKPQKPEQNTDKTHGDKRLISTFDLDESDNTSNKQDKHVDHTDKDQDTTSQPPKKIRLQTYRIRKAKSPAMVKSSANAAKVKVTQKSTTTNDKNTGNNRRSEGKQSSMETTGHNLHTLSESESEIDESRDPRFYRHDPTYSQDLPLPNFARRSRLPPNGPPVYPRSRMRETDQSFFDPRSGVEYIPVRRPEVIQNPSRREYYFADTDFLVPRSHYVPRRSSLPREYYYEDEPCPMNYEPRPVPIPAKYLGKADQSLVDISPQVHIPTATVTSDAAAAPAASVPVANEDPIPSTSSQASSQHNDKDSNAEKKSDKEPTIMEDEPDLMDEYLVPTEDDTSASLPSKLALVTSKIWDQGVVDFDALKVTESYDKLLRPANIDALVQTQINPEVKLKPQQPVTIRDRQFRSIQSSILKATFGVLKIMNSAYDPQSPVTHKQVIDTGIDTLRCLSYTNGRIHKLRRQNIRPVIHHTMRSICDKPAEKVSHAWLLGDDLKSKCKEMSEGIRLQTPVNKNSNKGPRKQNFRNKFSGFRRFGFNRFNSGRGRRWFQRPRKWFRGQKGGKGRGNPNNKGKKKDGN